MSTAAQLDLFEVPEPRRTAMLTPRCPSLATMTHRVHGSAVVRDNIRLSEAKLARVMTDMTVEQWLLLLDSKVFFFLQLCRLDRLLAVPGITTVAERADLHTRGSVPVWSRSDLR